MSTATTHPALRLLGWVLLAALAVILYGVALPFWIVVPLIMAFPIWVGYHVGWDQ